MKLTFINFDTIGKNKEYLLCIFVGHVDKFYLNGVEIEPLTLKHTNGQVPATYRTLFAYPKNIFIPVTFCDFEYDSKYFTEKKELNFTGEVRNLPEWCNE